MHQGTSLPGRSYVVIVSLLVGAVGCGGFRSWLCAPAWYESSWPAVLLAALVQAGCACWGAE